MFFDLQVTQRIKLSVPVASSKVCAFVQSILGFLLELRAQYLFESAAGTRQTRHDRTQRSVDHFGNLFVRQFFQIT